ncbi:MAG: hypothetical protein LUB61_01545 [Eggerthellaceae bacterium]|nr:hypothetical protein [Eggerthellaceae bacterium]
MDKGTKEYWQNIAAGWELMSLSFQYPDLKLVSSLETSEWGSVAKDLSDTLGLHLPENWDDELTDYELITDDETYEQKQQLMLSDLIEESTRRYIEDPVSVVPAQEYDLTV